MTLVCLQAAEDQAAKLQEDNTRMAALLQANQDATSQLKVSRSIFEKVF